MNRYLVLALLLSNLFQSACIATTDTANSKNMMAALENPLIHIANMKYEGAFIFNSDDFGFSSMHDAEGGMAFAPPKETAPNGSLFASGNYARGGVSEWAIPPLVKSFNVNELNMTEQPLQSFADLSDRAPKRRVELGYFADLLWIDNELLYSEHNYYPASNLDLHKMAVLRDANNLQGSTAAGYFRVNALSGEEGLESYTAKASAGWMSEIPEEWHTLLDGTHLMGPADGWNVEGRFAAGPSVFTFNPKADIVSKEPSAVISSEALVDYSTENPITEIGIVGENYYNAPSDLWNAMSFVHFGFIPSGSRTLMLIGNQWGINGDIGYKITQNNGELCGGPCPYDSDDKANYYWLIDLKDVFDARNGNRRYDSIMPYAYGPLPLPFQQGKEGEKRVNNVRGGAYDAKTGTVYFQIKGGDPRPRYQLRPVMVAYTFDTNTDYSVPRKPSWTLVAGKEPNRDNGPTFQVWCQSCDSADVAVNWQVPNVDAIGEPVSIDHYRLNYEKVNLPYINRQPSQRIGVSVAGNETQHRQTLSPGEWRVTIRAISTDGVPSIL